MVVIQKMSIAREIKIKKVKSPKKDAKKVVLVAQELKIARALAGNDPTVRNRTLKRLKIWFRNRSKNLDFTKNDFGRIWNGLFYSMWMSDKPLIQEECAEAISSLIHELPLEQSLLFFECGLIKLVKEWFGIDQLRLDKFMMFVRRFLRQALIVLKNNNYKVNFVIKFGEILNSTVLNTLNKDAVGLFMHFDEIFMEELAKVTEGNLKPDLMVHFLTPFTDCLSKQTDLRNIRHLNKFIFLYLINQSDAAFEYREKYDAWKEAGFRGSINSLQKVEIDNNDENSDEDEENDSQSKALDPRAGRVDVLLPQIKFHSKSIAEMLLKYKLGCKNLAARKTMSTLAKQFRKLSRGIYPLGVTDLKLPKKNNDTKLKKAVNRLVKFDKKIMGEGAKLRKRKPRNNKNGHVKRRKMDSKKEDDTVTTGNSSTCNKELFPRNEWDEEPLKPGEYELVIPSKSYLQKLKRISEKSTQNVQELIEKRLGKPRHSLPAYPNCSSTPQSVKRVKINTNLNQSQEFDEYHSQILCSPSIIFDGTKKPGKPLLKTSFVNSPVNPFYKQ